MNNFCYENTCINGFDLNKNRSQSSSNAIKIKTLTIVDLIQKSENF